MKHNLCKFVSVMLFSLLFFSCESNMEMILPQGPEGKSAYEVWVLDVAKGLDDPHNPGTQWDKSKTSTVDFWYYLTGVDGKSAYELWVEEVAKGLDDPHRPGELWDKDKTTLDDFWEYLRGADGLDGKFELGKQGDTITIIRGKANVIPLYSAQQFSEFVRPTDGSVAFMVYDDKGNPAPGAIVRGLPGMDTLKSYTAGTDGSFIVPKEDLPFEKPVSDRYSSTKYVTYTKSTGGLVTERSANNTYVPNKMQVRLIAAYDYFYIDRAHLKVQRKSEADADWEIIPSYLIISTQRVYSCIIDNPNDPTSYTRENYFNSTSLSPSSIDYAYQPRKIKQCDYYPLSANELWDGNDHYYTYVFSNCYGEEPALNAVIKMAPTQYPPLIKNVKAYGLDPTGTFFTKLEAEFDISQIDLNLIFNRYHNKQSISNSYGTFDYYTPILEDYTTFIAEKSMGLQFTSPSGDNIATSQSIYSNPSITVITPHTGSTVYTLNPSSYFSNSVLFANIILDSDGVWKLKPYSSSYTFSDIIVQVFP